MEAVGPATDLGGGEDEKAAKTVEMVDVDGDGDIDAVIGNSDGTVTTYFNEEDEPSTCPRRSWWNREHRLARAVEDGRRQRRRPA